MPKGPQGQKRPADTNACAVMVARIATGEVEEEISGGTGRSAGGRARAMVLAPEMRKEIASAAARARWQKSSRLEIEMSHTAQQGGSATAVSEAVRMYPNNQLARQVRPLDEAFSGFSMLREHYEKH